MSNINLICDNCGKEIKGGVYWTIGSKLCTKCYHEMNGNPASQYVDMLHKEMYELKIADLEAKLAECESKVKVGEFWHSAYQGKQLDYDKVYAELRKSYDENEKLKQQLAEKDLKIIELETKLNLKDKETDV